MKKRSSGWRCCTHVGIFGLGEIGLRIARRAEPFEVKVGYFNRSPRRAVFGAAAAAADFLSDIT